MVQQMERLGACRAFHEEPIRVRTHEIGGDKYYEKSRNDTYSKSSCNVGRARWDFVTVEATLAVSDIVVKLLGVGERDRLVSKMEEELVSDESGV